MNRIKIKLLFILVAVLNISVWANIKLPALVGDNMVLQRDANIQIWGWADPGEKVNLQFLGNDLHTKTGKDGKWTLDLSPVPAGGPYEMVIEGRNRITISNILVGDVWLASGQSNMGFKMYQTDNAETEIEIANYDQIRLFSVEHIMSFQPETDVNSNGWKMCTPNTVKNFSAVAYYFGKELYKKYGVPIGLINSSWGGSYAEAWISKNGLIQFPDFLKQADQFSELDNVAYKEFQKEMNKWLRKFAKIDRGRMPGEISWEDEHLDTDGWLTMNQPGIWSQHKELKGFNGVIWFRKEIDVPIEMAGQPIELNFGAILWTDSVFFNGVLIGSTTGYQIKRNYKVSGDLVKEGQNLITLRIAGLDYFGGLIGAPNELFALVGEEKIPLSGEWLYKTGSDISTYPENEMIKKYQLGMPNKPTLLFNSMIAPLIPYKLKGVIWYQGESNASNMSTARQYYTLFPSLINDWREKWGYEFSFLFVQLAGYQTDEEMPADYVWAHLREAQYKTLSLPNTGMAVAIDIGNEKDIHPTNKVNVGKRLALAAQKVAYKEDVVFSGPTYKRMKIEGNKIRLSLDNLGSGIWVKDKYSYIRGFAIAGADKKFVWAKAYSDGDDIIVYSEDIKEPVAVRYNWGNTPDGNLYNMENLPAVPFRTDDWLQRN